MKKIEYYLLLFLLFVPPLIFFTDLTRNPYFFQIMLVNGATVLYWMLRLWRGMKEGSLSLRPTPLDKPLIAFTAVATLSWLLMLFQNIGEPYLSYGVYNEGLKRWLYLIVNAVLVYYMAVNAVDDTNRRTVTLTVLWAGLLAAGYGILQYFGIEFFWPRVLNPFGGRSVSTFGNPNFLSSYLVLLFPVAFALYLAAGRSAGRKFYFMMMMLFFGALLCTLTRSSWLGLFIAMCITVGGVFVLERKFFFANRAVIMAPFIIMMALMFLWPKSSVEGYSPTVIGRLTESADAGKGFYAPWHQRRLIWSCAWHMAKENPLLGKGWGCFELFYPFYQGRHLFLPVYHGFRTHANNCHNEVLEIWSQTGLIGMGIYLWALVSIAAFFRFQVKHLSGDRRLLFLGFFASLCGMWVDNLLNVSLHFAIPGFLAWWNLGMFAGLAPLGVSAVPTAKAWRKTVIVVLIIAGVFAVIRYAGLFTAETRYFRGFKLSKQNQIAAAIPFLEGAHRLQRLEVNNNYELANCYARGGDRDKALWGYAESLRANAGYDEIYFNLATVLLQQGKYDQAITEYTRSIYINPLSLEAYNAMGSVFLQKPEIYGKAGIALLDQCSRLFPENKDILNNLGYLYTKTGQDKLALEAYKKAFAIDPDFDLARRNIRVTMNKLGIFDHTIEDIDRTAMTVERAIVAKNWQEALVAGERLAKLTPRSFKARLYLANIYFTVGRVADAIPEYEASLQIQPNNQSALGNFALALMENKQYDRARQEFQNLLKVEPNNQMARQKIDQLNNLMFAPR